MSLGRSSRFCSLGFAKVKSDKVLSSFAPASSITVHHGSMMCCQDPRHGCLYDLDEYGNAQVLESPLRHWVISSASSGMCFPFAELSYNSSFSFQTEYAISLNSFTRSFVIFLRLV